MVSLPFAILLSSLLFIKIIASTVPTKETVDTSVSYTPDEDTNNNYGDDSNSLFNKEWEEKMKEYDSDFIYSISIPEKSKSVYYENVTLVPAMIRGAIFTDYETKQKIEFGIIDSQNNVLYSNYTHQAIFLINVTVQGRYEIYFNNRLRTPVNLTITMNTGQNNILKQKDLTITEKKIESLDSFLKRIDVEFKWNRNLQKERHESKNFYIFFF